MTYARVFIDAIGYELPPVVMTSRELEWRLRPVYQKLRIGEGQLAALTGIMERRWWEPGYQVSQGATLAARKALLAARVPSSAIQALIYAGVCRELYEPATACRVAAGLDISPDAAVYDISNACLGVLNGMLDIANRIELGQIRAGLVVSCETAREINDVMIERLLQNPDMELFKLSLATLTGGSGAVAVLLTDGSFADIPPLAPVLGGEGSGVRGLALANASPLTPDPSPPSTGARGETRPRRRLLGGVTQAAPEFHDLCRWGTEKLGPNTLRPFMSTDSIAVLKHGVALGTRTWAAFLRKLGWTGDQFQNGDRTSVLKQVDKVICHQVGSAHRDTILQLLGIPADKDFSTYEYLGNIGTVSLPLTAALAEERDALQPGDRVAFLGIGSGLNCMMLGIEW